MKILKVAAFAIGILQVDAMVTPAQAAQTFDWSMTGPAASLGGFPLLESGQLTATLLSPGKWSVDTLTVDGLTGNQLTSYYLSDNIIYTNPGFASLSTGGLAFNIGGGAKVDVFSFDAQGTPPTGNAYGELVSSGGFGVGTFNLTAVPEPSTWMMMLAGFGALGLMLRQSKRKLGLRFKNVVAA